MFHQLEARLSGNPFAKNGVDAAFNFWDRQQVVEEKKMLFLQSDTGDMEGKHLVGNGDVVHRVEKKHLGRLEEGAVFS